MGLEGGGGGWGRGSEKEGGRDREKRQSGRKTDEDRGVTDSETERVGKRRRKRQSEIGGTDRHRKWETEEGRGENRQTDGDG